MFGASDSYIVLNFLHGNGPYLRTLELALAVNDALEDRGEVRKGIIVPLVYGDKQKLIIEENFGETIRRRPFEILFDPVLGAHLESLLYHGGGSYEHSLRCFVEGRNRVESLVRKHLQSPFVTHTFAGVEVTVEPKRIDLEISRCPQVSMGIKKAYYSGFDYISRILDQALADPNLTIDKKLLETCIPMYEDIEEQYLLHFIAEPATFTYLKNRTQKYKSEILTPPNTNQIRYFSYSPLHEKIHEGVYVTVTGIPGLENLFQDLQKLGYFIYTHRPELIPGSIKAPPDVLAHPKIKFHFARSGWGSIWLSFMTGTPFIARPYHPNDDLEIYFNNICLDQIGIGKVYYENTTAKELLDFEDSYKKKVESIKSYLIQKYDTLNGVKYTAERIVNSLNQN